MKVREVEVRYGKTVAEVDGRKMLDQNDVAKVLREFIGDATEERFVVLHLDTRNRVKAIQEVSRGTVSASLVHPREVFRAAIIEGATGIILGHNHPSGDTTPSSEDIAITKRLVDAGSMLGIKILDHVIIGDNHYSFNDAGSLRGNW